MQGQTVRVRWNLIENYQAQDMLGMADCLKGSAEEMILCLEAEENQSPEK